MKAERVEVTAVRDHAVLTGRAGEKGVIEGVVVRSLVLHADERGHFAEVFRAGDPVAAGFEVLQSSITLTRPGVIKAFHLHLGQDDLFCPIAGTARVVLIDFRSDAATFGVANSIFAGARYPRAIRIPAGVAHGYEVLPGEDLVMVYYTDRTYDPADEQRIPYDDPRVGFPAWGIRNR